MTSSHEIDVTLSDRSERLSQPRWEMSILPGLVYLILLGKPSGESIVACVLYSKVIPTGTQGCVEVCRRYKHRRGKEVVCREIVGGM